MDSLDEIKMLKVKVVQLSDELIELGYVPFDANFFSKLFSEPNPRFSNLSKYNEVTRITYVLNHLYGNTVSRKEIQRFINSDILSNVHQRLFTKFFNDHG